VHIQDANEFGTLAIGIEISPAWPVDIVDYGDPAATKLGGLRFCCEAYEQ
jgi:hypothetical protein